MSKLIHAICSQVNVDKFVETSSKTNILVSMPHHEAIVNSFMASPINKPILVGWILRWLLRVLGWTSKYELLPREIIPFLIKYAFWFTNTFSVSDGMQQSRLTSPSYSILCFCYTVKVNIFWLRTEIASESPSEKYLFIYSISGGR